MTTVWLCEPRSHGRNKAASPLPGRRPSATVPHRSASPALCPCGHAEHSKQPSQAKRFNAMMSSKKFVKTRMMRFMSSMLDVG